MLDNRQQFKFSVQIQEKGWRIPAINRLRAMLKNMKRAYGIECLSLEPENPSAKQAIGD